jgi:hypothetical protein
VAAKRRPTSNKRVRGRCLLPARHLVFDSSWWLMWCDVADPVRKTRARSPISSLSISRPLAGTTHHIGSSSRLLVA